MLEVIGSTGVYVIIGVVVLAVASLLGLVLFASKEETFEDVVAAQKKEQEALLNSLQGSSSKSGKPNKKWNKLKSKKASKKEHDDPEVDSGVDDDEPSSDSVAVPPKVVESAPVPSVKSSKKSKKVKSTKQVEPVKDTVTSTEPIYAAEPDVSKQQKEVEKPKKLKPKKEPRKIVEDVIVTSEEIKVEAGISYPEEQVIVVSTEEVSLSAPPEPLVETSQKKPKSGKSKQRSSSKTQEGINKYIPSC